MWLMKLAVSKKSLLSSGEGSMVAKPSESERYGIPLSSANRSSAPVKLDSMVALNNNTEIGYDCVEKDKA